LKQYTTHGKGGSQFLGEKKWGRTAGGKGKKAANAGQGMKNASVKIFQIRRNRGKKLEGKEGGEKRRRGGKMLTLG